MILTNMQVIKLDQGINFVRAKLMNEIPIATGYKFIKVKQNISSQVVLLKELREEVISSLGTVREDGSIVFESEDKKKQAEDQIQELLEIEEEYDISRINVSALSEISAPYDVIEALHPILTDL